MRKARSFCACGASSRGVGASSFSGGMRTACPASSRSFGWVRLPFTRTSPLRMMRWIWLNDRPGKRASKKRSTRMPDSSGVTVTVCTPAENCVAFGAVIRRGSGGRRSLGVRTLVPISGQSEIGGWTVRFAALRGALCPHLRGDGTKCGACRPICVRSVRARGAGVMLRLLPVAAAAHRAVRPVAVRRRAGAGRERPRLIRSPAPSAASPNIPAAF